MGSGSLLLPIVTGAYSNVFPLASRTVSDFVAPATITSTPAGFAPDVPLASAAGVASGAGFAAAALLPAASVFTGISNGSTAGTLMVSPAAHVAVGFSALMRAGLA